MSKLSTVVHRGQLSAIAITIADFDSDAAVAVCYEAAVFFVGVIWLRFKFVHLQLPAPLFGIILNTLPLINKA